MKTGEADRKLRRFFFVCFCLLLSAEKCNGIVDVADLDCGRAFCFFTIQGPFNIGRTGEGEYGSPQEKQGRIIVVTGPEGCDNPVQGKQVLGEGNEQRLKKTVAHVDLGVIQLQDAAQGSGITHGTKDVIILIFPAVSIDLHMNGMNVRQGANAFQDIGGMADYIFHILGRGPGNTCEGPEGSGIAEIAIRTEEADIQEAGLAEDNGITGRQRFQGQIKPVGKVVGAAAGNVSQWGFMTALPVMTSFSVPSPPQATTRSASPPWRRAKSVASPRFSVT